MIPYSALAGKTRHALVIVTRDVDLIRLRYAGEGTYATVYKVGQRLK